MTEERQREVQVLAGDDPGSLLRQPGLPGDDAVEDVVRKREGTEEPNTFIGFDGT